MTMLQTTVRAVSTKPSNITGTGVLIDSGSLAAGESTLISVILDPGQVINPDCVITVSLPCRVVLAC